MKFQVIETSMDPVASATFAFPAGCHPASKPAKNGRMARKMKEVECHCGDTTKIVAITANNAPMMR